MNVLAGYGSMWYVVLVAAFIGALVKVRAHNKRKQPYRLDIDHIVKKNAQKSIKEMEDVADSTFKDK